MSVSLEKLGIDQLSVRDRLELIEQIWDSLPEQVHSDEIPEWHRKLFAERHAEAERSPGIGRPWREALSRYRDGMYSTR